MNQLLIATSNRGKFKEYEIIFRQLEIPLKLLSLQDFHITQSPEESGTTFGENARIKAKFYYHISKMPTLADDGGIEIEYLGGEPGVISRRWPGYEATDEELVAMTFEKLQGVPWKKRGATLRVAIAFVFDEQHLFTFEGAWHGYIVEKRSAAARLVPGYPFRSLFWLPETETVLGELPFEKEVELGHRKQALSKTITLLKSHLVA